MTERSGAQFLGADFQPDPEMSAEADILVLDSLKGRLAMSAAVALIVLSVFVAKGDLETVYAQNNQILGDVNCNKAVDPVDAAIILFDAAGYIHNLKCAGNADVDFDGTISVVDSLLILQRHAGLILHFPQK